MLHRNLFRVEFSNLKKEVGNLFDISIASYQNTLRHNKEESNIHCHTCENLRCYSESINGRMVNGWEYWLKNWPMMWWGRGIEPALTNTSNTVQGRISALALNISLYDESNENSHSTLTSFAWLYEEHVLMSKYLYSNRSSERRCLRNYNRHSKRVYPVLPFSGIYEIPTMRVT
jgi:hypothetical protein